MEYFLGTCRLGCRYHTWECVLTCNIDQCSREHAGHMEKNITITIAIAGVFYFFLLLPLYTMTVAITTTATTTTTIIYYISLPLLLLILSLLLHLLPLLLPLSLSLLLSIAVIDIDFAKDSWGFQWIPMAIAWIPLCFLALAAERLFGIRHTMYSVFSQFTFGTFHKVCWG